MRIQALLILTLLPLPWAHAQEGAAVRLESVIADDADIVVMIDDMPGFLERWEGSPLGGAWADPQFERVLAPFRAEIEIDRWEEIVESGTGYELSEILGSFTGQVALILPDLSVLMDETGKAEEPLALVAAIRDDGGILQALMGLDMESQAEELAEDEKYEEIEEEFQGVTLHVRQLTSPDGVEQSEGWAVVDGFYVMAEPMSYLQEIVARVKRGGGPSSIADSAGFRKMRERVPAADLLLYLNLQSVVPWAGEAMLSDAGEGQSNLLGIDPGAVLGAMSLDVLESIFVSATIHPDATHVDFGVLYSEDKGVVKLLAIQPGPVNPPGFLPEDALETSVMNFSFSEAWQSLKEIFQTVNPALIGMLEMQLQQLASTGVDLEKGLLGSLGESVFSAEFPRPVQEPGEQPSLAVLDQLFGVSVNDPQTLEMGLEALKNLIGSGSELFEVVEYLDYTIYRWKEALSAGDGGDDQRLSYALTEDYLLFSLGSDAPLRRALSRHSRPPRKVWDRAEVKSAVKKLPANPSGLSYYDTRGLIRGAIEGCQTLQSMMPDDSDAEDGELPGFCDPEAQLDDKTIARYFGLILGAQYKDSGGFYSTLRLMHPDE